MDSGADDDTVVLPVVRDGGSPQRTQRRQGHRRAGRSGGVPAASMLASHAAGTGVTGRPGEAASARVGRAARRAHPGHDLDPDATDVIPKVPSAPADRVRTALGVTGEVLITLGLVVLLFVVYEVYVTDWLSAAKQHDATSALDRSWSGEAPADPGNQRTEKFRPGDGEGFAKLYVPAFGSDFVFTVLEGTSDRVLEIGPGHYKGTAFPGEPGNFAVAGHRVGKGAPFNDLDLLRSCDAIVVETRQSWVVYRVLPMRDELAGWDAGRGADPRCAGVHPLGGRYAGVPGREIVLPSQRGVIAPVPGHPELSFDAVPPEEQAALITLTTCHPRFSAAKRMVLHGVFAKEYPKDPADPGARPPELTEG